MTRTRRVHTVELDDGQTVLAMTQQTIAELRIGRECARDFGTSLHLTSRTAEFGRLDVRFDFDGKRFTTAGKGDWKTDRGSGWTRARKPID